jgi:hypothetical protein
MLTFIVQNKDASVFIVDEPDIYLHSDLQRQLVGILKSLGPDILIATHSTEIITDADPDDLLVVNKKFKSGKRLKDASQLQGIFHVLGSNLHPVLTQLAKTKRALFVEGKDFQVLSRFARRIGNNPVSNRSDFAVVPLDGFNSAKIKDLVQGIEITLGAKIITAAIFDRDYRSDTECRLIVSELEKQCFFAHIHERKEIENFLLFPEPIRRAIEVRCADYKRRTDGTIDFKENITTLLQELTGPMRHRVQARYLGQRMKFQKTQTPHLDETTITEELMNEYDAAWNDLSKRLLLVPGKETLAALNTHLQEHYGISITASLIIDSFMKEEIPIEMTQIIDEIERFRTELELF